MQTTLALALAAGWMRNHCPQVLKCENRPNACESAFNRAHNLFEQLKTLPKWKKWIFNKLMK